MDHNIIEHIPKEQFEFQQLNVELHDKKLQTKSRGYFADAMLRFKKNKSSVVAAWIILFLVIFAIGMGVLFLCNRIAPYASGLAMNLIAIFGGIFISFAIGAFFSVSYSVPTTLAQLEVKRSGKNIAAMLFAVQGLFEGIAAGVATGGVLVLLKSLDVIALLPIVVILCCVAVFFISFLFPSDVKYMGKEGDGK